MFNEIGGLVGIAVANSISLQISLAAFGVRGIIWPKPSASLQLAFRLSFYTDAHAHRDRPAPNAATPKSASEKRRELKRAAARH